MIILLLQNFRKSYVINGFFFAFDFENNIISKTKMTVNDELIIKLHKQVSQQKASSA